MLGPSYLSTTSQIQWGAVWGPVFPRSIGEVFQPDLDTDVEKGLDGVQDEGSGGTDPVYTLALVKR